MIGVPVLWIGSFVVVMLDKVLGLGLESEAWSTSVDLASNIALVIWAFSVRLRLNRLWFDSGQERSGGPFLTFFFTHLYVSFNINQAIDRASGTA